MTSAGSNLPSLLPSMASKAFWTLSSLERAFAKARGGKERRRCGGSGGLSFRCFFFGLLDAPPMAARARTSAGQNCTLG